MTCCDICGTTAECVQKEIDGKEFDLCDRCWRPLAEKMSAKAIEEARIMEQASKELKESDEFEETLI